MWLEVSEVPQTHCFHLYHIFSTFAFGPGANLLFRKEQNYDILQAQPISEQVVQGQQTNRKRSTETTVLADSFQ